MAREREPSITKLRLNSNEGVLIKCEPRFCYCTAYFGPKMFSETDFSVQSTCLLKVCEQKAPAILSPLL